MNLEHAVQTIAKRGFTDRQARFLVLVARHSGVCVMRQYSSFAGIVFGQKTRKFFANLVRLGFVSTYDCAHNRGRVYHVRHRAIYEAIGEPDSRLRRPPGVPRALERLMLLDAILENPESIWMSSSTEKLGYLASRGISADDAPHLSIRQGDQRQVRHFPDRLPIGVHPSGHVVVVYLHADPMHDEFRDFLQRHAPLLERLPAWTIRIVVPAHLEGAVQDLQKVAWGQLASPLKEPILTELRWYFDRLLSARRVVLSRSQGTPNVRRHATHEGGADRRRRPSDVASAKFKPAGAGSAAPFKAAPPPIMAVYVARMLARLRDRRFDFLLNVHEYDGAKKDLDDLVREWTEHQHNITIFDLAGVPSEIIDLVVGLITRILLKLFSGAET